MKIHARQIGRIPVSQIDGISIYNTEKFENVVNGQTEFTITVVDDHTTIGACFLEINGVVYNEGEAFTRNELTITWNNTFEIEDDMVIILKMGSLTEGGTAQGGGLTELPESASFKTLKVEDSMEIGKRGPVGPPNPNNLYVNGAIYAMPKEEAFTVTGPGAAGGNIFLQPGKAVCSFTKRGPYEKEDGTMDSGIRTIGFVAQVSEEDKANNEDSVYLGTNISRMYLYSRTAFPTIVSNKQLFRSVTKTTRDGVQVASEEPTESVQTISPMATQEWTMELLKSLGVIGGQIDQTQYETCTVDALKAFDTNKSMLFMDQWQRNHNWNLGTDGSISLSGKDGNIFAPLFQKNVWNEVYYDLSNIHHNDIKNCYFVLYSNFTNAYVLRFDKNSYSIALITKYGQKSNEYNYALKLNPSKLTESGTVLRFRYDSDNESGVFSLVRNGVEESLLTISKYAFSGLHMFESENTQVSLGLACQVRHGQDSLPKIVNKPDNFTPNAKSAISDYAVVRYRHLSDQIQTCMNEEIESRVAREVKSRIAEEVEKAVNTQMTSLLRMIKEEK